MPAYRHYRLDGAGGIKSAEWLEASDDEDALRKVRALDLREGSELWFRNRLIGRVGPTVEK